MCTQKPVASDLPGANIAQPPTRHALRPRSLVSRARAQLRGESFVARSRAHCAPIRRALRRDLAH
eukprot:3396536-Pleurochrysis_carterae.AAC.1